MHDFGKLTGQVEAVELAGGQVVQIYVFYDAANTEWHDLYKSLPPFDFYVALDDNDCVVSMEPDPEHSQIAGYRIIGISKAEAGDFTRGPGGTVYGMKWSGNRIVNPIDLMSPEERRAAMPPLTPRQFRDALIDNDIMPDDVTAAINQIADSKARAKALNAWEYPTEFLRTDQLLEQIGASFSLSPDAIDAMWAAATYR
ncbi:MULTISPECIES: hypothetical protein [Rhizobium]|uniref:Uncharacterized protein n=1 Tax=Rhizobium paranaense TaxID=1650438 RepID=A0A7W8XVN0_9HYPH|nr:MULTISPECIES: hypothetical protein [Rhizobium]MBB5576387.1 hypothetical protein [Rhizobium paranaense]PST62573.1 hypothetical protein C9E91_13610 [Rhizobium sp. SEMIA4064]